MNKPVLIDDDTQYLIKKINEITPFKSDEDTIFMALTHMFQTMKDCRMDLINDIVQEFKKEKGE